jgi:hypothetical protein
MQYLGAEGFVLALAAVLGLYIFLIGQISDVQRATIPVPAVARAMAARARAAAG